MKEQLTNQRERSRRLSLARVPGHPGEFVTSGGRQSAGEAAEAEIIVKDDQVVELQEPQPSA